MSRQKSTREDLVEAATQLLAEESISHFNIGRICERAGISRRSFFNYFKDRNDLLTEVLKVLRASHKKAMQEWSADLPEELPVEDRILAIFRRILGIIHVPGWRGSAFIRLSGELDDLDGHVFHEMIALAKLDQEEWFEHELRRGEYQSPSVLATQLTIIMTGLFQLQLIHRSPHLGEAVLAMIPQLLAANSSEIHRTIA